MNGNRSPCENCSVIEIIVVKNRGPTPHVNFKSRNQSGINNLNTDGNLTFCENHKIRSTSSDKDFPLLLTGDK